MPIHIAVTNGDIQAVHTAIKLNPRCIFEINDQNFTPLHIAAKCGKSEIIELLCDTAASQGRLDYLMLETLGGTTAIEFALNNGHFAAIKLMLKYKPDISHKNKDGLTILHKLIMLIAKDSIGKEQAYQMMELFLVSGINPHQTDNGMDTYLKFIKMYKLPVDYWRLLFLYGAGIGFNFSSLNIIFSEEIDLEEQNINLDEEIDLVLPIPDPSELIKVEWLNNATAGQLICGTWLGKKITNDTPGFKDAVTDSKQLRNLLEIGGQIKYKYLLNVINCYLGPNKSLTISPILESELAEILKTLVAYSFPSLREIVARKIKFFHDNHHGPVKKDEHLKKLSDQQIADLTRLPTELQIYLIDVGGVNIPRPASVPPPKKPS